MRIDPASFARRAEPSAHELGQLGEIWVARQLRQRGWRVLAHRMRTPWGEVDWLFDDGHELILVEVKTRKIDSLPAPRGVRISVAPIQLSHIQRRRLETAQGRISRALKRRVCLLMCELRFDPVSGGFFLREQVLGRKRG